MSRAHKWWGRSARRLSSGAQSREGFGSFHSEDIERLLRQTTAEYRPPAIHDVLCSGVLTPHVVAQLRGAEYGHACKKLLFHLDPSWTFLNHGAFGAALRPLIQEAAAWRVHAETQPLRFFDRELLPLVAHSVREMAVHLGCLPTQLLPLPNVTAGLNAILVSIEPTLRRGDTLVCTNLTYGATKKMLAALAERTGATLFILPLRLPLSRASALADFVAHLAPRGIAVPRLVVLDSVTSNTVLALPIMEITQYIRQAYPSCNSSSSTRDPLIVIDAAHSLHSDPDLSLSLPSSHELFGGADYWLSNGHKWLCMPKGAAFMWISERARATLRPAIVSHGFDVALPGAESTAARGDRVHSAFAWDGCRDYAALLTTPSALRIWTSVLPPPHAYTTALLRDATALLLEEWQSAAWRISAGEAADGPAVPRLPAPPMSLVPLPALVAGTPTTGCTDKQAFQVQEWLHHKHRIEAPVKCVQGRLFVRISAHVYNSLDDYRHLARIVLHG